MKERIFDYQSYKVYLNDLIRSRPARGRGMKTALASAAQCQTTYVSMVLQGERHFSLEQAEAINQFLQHSVEEARFFILLVSRERAGTPALRHRLEREIKIEIDKYHDLKHRLKAKKETLSPEVQATYYRTWYNTAVHVCLTVAKMRTKESISKALGIPVQQVSEALEFLVSVGLAEKRAQEYFTGENVVFVGRDSPFLTHHHINWRQQAIRSIELNRERDVHYSGVVSLRAEDSEKLRNLFLKSIEEARAIWKNSTNEEGLHAICVDFFRISQV